jgi:hypothetical protein
MKLIIEDVGKPYRRDFWGLHNFSLELGPEDTHRLLLMLHNTICILVIAIGLLLVKGPWRLSKSPL